MILEFGEWLPDQPALSNPGCTEAKNCFPVKTSYKPMRDLVTFSAALTERPYQAFPAKSADLNTHMFVGSGTKLCKLATSTVWADVSILAGYTAADWDFTQYGDLVIAVNISDPIQEYTLGVSSLFADLVATINASTVASSEQFVMVGNTNDTTDGPVPHRIRWCAIGDPTDWVVSAATQSDFQDLNSNYGEVKKVVYNGDFYAFQEKAITRLSYIGSPAVFNIDTFEMDRGTKYQGSVASVGDRIFYLSEDGFYMLRYSESTPIGADKVDKTFFIDLHDSYAERIRATADPINNLIIWAYPSIAMNGELDKQIIYNWKNNRWSSSDYTLSNITQSSSLGYTLEGLDAITTNLDALPLSLDSRAWQGGEVSLASFDKDWRFSFFTGATKSATMETAEFQPVEGQQSHLSRIRALTDAVSTAQIGVRNTQTGAPVWSSVYSAEPNGDIPVREKARYHRIRLITTGDYDDIQGAEIMKALPAGGR